jgi:hypothetical protein
MMTKRDPLTLRHEFVEHAPDVLEAGILYVSMS